MGEKLTKVNVRNIVFHDFKDVVLQTAKFVTVDDAKLNTLVSKVMSAITDAGFTTHPNVIAEFVVELILSEYDVYAFGLKPLVDAQPETRPVTDILNELVKQKKLSKHWVCK